MAETAQRGATAPSTAEGFLADRLRFWHKLTKYMTVVAVGLAVFLAALWYFLV